MIHERNKRLSHWLREILGEQTPEGVPKNKAIARRMVNIALDPRTKTAEFIHIVSEMLDRLEGKAMQTNVNAEIALNPFEGIDTAQLEALRQKLIEVKPCEPDKQIGSDADRP